MDSRSAREPQAVQAIRIGLINNMPDSALDGTESQFNGLLEAAGVGLDVHLRYSSLPEVPRGAEAAEKIASRYWSLDALLADPPDALIVTGAEPKAPTLIDEPYWGRLCAVLDFADRYLISSAWSCLAAHAAVLHLDGIERRRLSAKRFGVFEQTVLREHALTANLTRYIQTPHSRWNNLPIDSLAGADYEILTKSADDHVDVFYSKRASLLLFFQGHPEYEDRTLLKEYQRDVGRFVSGEYLDYPLLPAGYFNAAAQDALAQFERDVKRGALPEPLTAFPFAVAAQGILNHWRPAAERMYRNWFEFIAARKHAA